ncbi:hypothetical protein A2819_01715 [Candidatus Azambacteria bacterium RIFCSPHIGHO2_01_FULL_40_24]|uniref:Bacterial Ig-like domain-containing protein n=1 Tax=Candidatus Azambacteria bacterium RIFCSPHIGHO2_01_FULL_40_24 TaxID=1797301 RepID=A0A1F5B369_9BACT|nr:MAG: hypothetical protein A2819_01715 [Candidatus Azambacteria bacterium RIFCSPHIGHO2_01_FULL_40_24]
MSRQQIFLVVAIVGAVGIFSLAYTGGGVPSRLLLAKGGGGTCVGDCTSPTVSITEPVDGSMVSRGSIVVIAAIASDNVGIMKVDFYVSNKLQCSLAVAPYTCNWNVPKGANKSYSLQARAYDAAGFSSYSNTVSVIAR